MPHIVVIGGSAGSIPVLKVILQGLPKDFPAPVLVVTHIGPHDSVLPNLLERCSFMPVRHAVQGEPIVPSQVLLAPPNLHLTVARSGPRFFVHLSRGPKENHSRPAIDPLFRSAAAACGDGTIGVVLSGFLDDGTVGLQAIKAHGGVALVQDPDEAEVPDMPASAMQYAAVDAVRRAVEIAPALAELLRGPARPAELAAGPAATELRQRIAIESRIFDGEGGMEGLDKIGTRVPLTCPECGGAIWEIGQANPLRYRCHTGHAFTGKVLARLQGNEVEEAMWAAVRALHEQEQLFMRLHSQFGASRAGMPDASDPRGAYLGKAEQARHHGQLLRDLLAARMSIAQP
jgi:two-component system chemotaxis response regulator CheB